MYRWILALAATATLAMPGWGQTQNYFGTTGAVTNLTWSTVIAGPYTSAFATNASGGIANFNNAATVSSGSGIFTWAGANFNAAVTWAAGGTFTNQGNGVIPINVSTGNTINFGS